MANSKHIFGRAGAALLTVFCFIGFAQLQASAAAELSAYAVQFPQYVSNDGGYIDYTNISDGYIRCRYRGQADKALVQITKPGSTKIYDYYLQGIEYEQFSFYEGNGTYRVRVMEHGGAGVYYTVVETVVEVELGDSFIPYLMPNQLCRFEKDSMVAGLSQEIAGSLENETDKIEAIYQYVIGNIAYDEEKAASDRTGYLPVLDDTIVTGEGICLDYASLLTAMLRIQGIPARLELGTYDGDYFHAWVSVYSSGGGKVGDNAVLVKNKWNRLDPTFAANSELPALTELIASYGKNYEVLYSF